MRSDSIPGQWWSPPRSWSTAWRRTGRAASRDSLAPCGEPGTLTMSVAPRAATTPRERAAVGVTITPAARMSSGMPGTSRSAIAMVASGCPIRGRQPGAAGGDDEPIAIVRERCEEARKVRLPVGDDGGLRFYRPTIRLEAGDELGPDRVRTRSVRGAGGDGHDDCLGTPLLGHGSAWNSPLRPPDFSSRRTRSITMFRWSALAMS